MVFRKKWRKRKLFHCWYLIQMRMVLNWNSTWAVKRHTRQDCLLLVALSIKCCVITEMRWQWWNNVAIWFLWLYGGYKKFAGVICYNNRWDTFTNNIYVFSNVSLVKFKEMKYLTNKNYCFSIFKMRMVLNWNSTSTANRYTIQECPIYSLDKMNFVFASPV